MAGKTLIGGVAYDVKPGKTLVDGVAYDITAGKTQIGGVAYDIKLGGLELTLSGALKTSLGTYRRVEQNGTAIDTNGVYPIARGDSLKILFKMAAGGSLTPNRILLNGTQVAKGGYNEEVAYTLTVESSVSVAFSSVKNSATGRVNYWKAEVTTS